MEDKITFNYLGGDSELETLEELSERMDGITFSKARLVEKYRRLKASLDKAIVQCDAAFSRYDESTRKVTRLTDQVVELGKELDKLNGEENDADRSE